MSKQLAFAIITVLCLVSVGSPAMGQVFVFRDPIRFDRLAQAPAVPIPDSATVFPGTVCGAGDRGPKGIGQQVVLTFGSSNRVTITGAQGNSLCLFDAGTLIGPPGNTEPSFMIANTIVGNGPKDLRLVFDSPIQAVAIRLLTNNTAQEVATFKDIAGNTIDTVDIDRFTPRNDRVFVGFISRRPIKEIVMVINIGNPGQNEGIDAIKIAETVSASAQLSSDQ